MQHKLVPIQHLSFLYRESEMEMKRWKRIIKGALYDLAECIPKTLVSGNPTIRNKIKNVKLSLWNSKSFRMYSISVLNEWKMSDIINYINNPIISQVYPLPLTAWDLQQRLKRGINTDKDTLYFS